MIGPKHQRHPLKQSDSKLRAITTWSPAFSRALGNLLVFTLSRFSSAPCGIVLCYDWLLNALVLLWGSLSKCAPTEDSITYDIRGYKRKRKQVSRKVMLLTADRVATSASKTSLTFIALARRLFRSFLVFSFFLRGSWSVYYFISEQNSTKGKIISICEGL